MGGKPENCDVLKVKRESVLWKRGGWAVSTLVKGHVVGREDWALDPARWRPWATLEFQGSKKRNFYLQKH